MRGALLALALLLAGCAAPPPPVPSAPATPRELVLGDCVNLGGLFGVPQDAAQRYLPEGFEALPADNDPRGGVRLYVEGMRCANATLDGAALGPFAGAYEELEVVPPAALQRADVGSYTVPLLFLAAPEAAAHALEAWRFARAQPAQVDAPAATDTPAARHATLRAAGANATLRIDSTASPAAARAQEALHVRQFGVAPGAQGLVVASVVDVNVTASTGMLGAVLVQASGDAPLAPDGNAPNVGGQSIGYTLDLVRTDA